MLPTNLEMFTWESYDEDISSLVDSSTITAPGLLEQINVTRDTSDYLWYITRWEWLPKFLTWALLGLLSDYCLPFCFKSSSHRINFCFLTSHYILFCCFLFFSYHCVAEIDFHVIFYHSRLILSPGDSTSSNYRAKGGKEYEWIRKT